jgi:hypothetical protein
MRASTSSFHLTDIFILKLLILVRQRAEFSAAPARAPTDAFGGDLLFGHQEERHAGSDHRPATAPENHQQA